MDGITFAAIGYSEALQEAGMPRKQADLIAKTQEVRIDAVVRAGDLATKQDLAETEAMMTKAMYNAFFGLIAAVAAISGAVFSLLK